MGANNESLERDGYILLKNILTPSDLQVGLAAYEEGGVNYQQMDTYIQNKFFPRINEQLGAQLVYTKFRPSNNNNSSDASTLHRDVICFGERIPALTCLTYFDPTEMELIPGSHRFTPTTWQEAYTLYSQRRTIEIKSGDVLVFYATLLHRGIFTGKSKQRRLLQVFDCFASPAEQQKYSDAIIHVPTYKPTFLSSLSITLSKLPIVIDAMTAVAFVNASFNYGGTMPVFENCDVGKRTTFSSEGVQTRVPLTASLQPSNHYCFNPAAPKPFDLPEACKPQWSWSLYTRQVLKTLFLCILCAALLSYGAYKLWTAKNGVVRRVGLRATRSLRRR
jgi:hypothetical protein